MLFIRVSRGNVLKLATLEQGSGFDLIEAKRGVNSETRVGVLSNCASPQCRERRLQAAARYCFDKPFSFA